MQFFQILIPALVIVLLVLAWCFLQTYNAAQRKSAPAAPRAAVREGDAASVVTRRADVSPAGELVRYVTFNVRGKGRLELAIPTGYDDDVLSPGNQGQLFCDETGFVRFEQTY